MNWRASLKARHFVASLHDHFIDRFNEADLPFGMGEDRPLPLSNNGLAAALTTPGPTSSNDRWCLRYMTIAFVPPILQAFDDDASGFVSIFLRINYAFRVRFKINHENAAKSATSAPSPTLPPGSAVVDANAASSAPAGVEARIANIEAKIESLQSGMDQIRQLLESLSLRVATFTSPLGSSTTSPATT